MKFIKKERALKHLGLFIVLLSSSILTEAKAACGRNSLADLGDISVVNSSFTVTKDEEMPLVTTIGTIRNSSDSAVDCIVLEIKYFDANSNLIDVYTEPLSNVVVLGSQEVAFRVRDDADKSETFASSKVRVVSAEQRPIQQSNQSRAIILEILLSWGPAIIFLVALIIYMRIFAGRDGSQDRIVNLMEKQNSILERIADATEQIIMNRTDEIHSGGYVQKNNQTSQNDRT